MKRIKLTQGKFAIVDDGDFEWLNQWKWQAYKGRNTFYAARSIRVPKRCSFQMHREILQPPAHLVTDHRNHNGLDNRRCNLRAVTNAQNQWNRRCKTYCGCSWNKRNKKWIAQISHNGKDVYLGYYKLKIDATTAYIEAKSRLRNM